MNYTIDTDAAFTDKQHEAAVLLAKGASTKDVAEAVGVTARSVRSWLRNQSYVIFINSLAAKSPAAMLPRIFREKFGIPRISALRDLLLIQLFFFSTSDLAGAYDDEGRLLPVSEMPPELRMSIQEIDFKKGKIKLVDKIAANREIFAALGLRDPRQTGTKLDEVKVDVAALLADREEETPPALAPDAGEAVVVAQDGYTNAYDRAKDRAARDE